MTAVTFDTLKAKEVLTAAGVTDTHAGAIVEITREAVTEGVATKTDIADLKTDIAGLETKIANLRADISRVLWMQGGIVIGAVVALVKLLP